MTASTVLNDGEPLRSSAENIGPDDPRYGDLVRRGFNKRFEGRPDYVRLAGVGGGWQCGVAGTVSRGSWRILTCGR
jgi:hypothetical protein